MIAKLPTGDGFKNKQIVEVARHGENVFYVLKEDEGDRAAVVWIVVNDMLIGLAGRQQLSMAVDAGRIPREREALVSIVRDNLRQGSAYGSTHKLVWEALGLPEEEREGLLAAKASKRAAEDEVFAQRRRASDERAAAAEAEKAREAEQAERKWLGFTGRDRWSSAPLRQRAIDALTKQLSVRHVVKTRGEHVKDLVSQGFRVKDTPSGRRLQHPETLIFFTEKDLSKTAIDFATYLVELGFT
jgi:hypothetical protein